jgi:hypothetical protein
MDEVSRRLSLLVPGELGAVRVNERLPVDLQPVADPGDLDRSAIMPSLYPVRRSQWPIALQSNGQYEEWQDENSYRKHAFNRLSAGGVNSPGVPPENWGTWMSYDEYRLAVGIAPRGSYASDFGEGNG